MNIELQSFDRQDFDRLLSWIHSEEDLVQWSGPYFTYPLTIQQLEDYLATAGQQPPPRFIFKAMDTGSHRVVGHIELNNVDYRNCSASVSKVLVDPSLRGQGIGIQMVAAIQRFAFEQANIHRLDLRVFDFNTPAVRTYQKLGFLIEGHLRDYRKVGDQYWSSYIMACIEDDWRFSSSDGQDRSDAARKALG